METKHKYPENIIVGENDLGYALEILHTKGLLSGLKSDILSKKDHGTNARFTAQELCDRYNNYPSILKQNEELQKDNEENVRVLRMYIELVRQLMPAMGNTEQYRTVKGLNDLTELRLNVQKNTNG